MPVKASMLIGLVIGLSFNTSWAVNIATVPVGNPGNVADSTGFGSVGYTYNIGKHEVTAGQYTAFLNAVAKTDAYGLYNTKMDYDANPLALGCNIKRSGTSNNYTYSVATDWANRPVAFVSWGDAARFCNWLTNGQPTDDQAINATEDGSYALNGSTSMLGVVREVNARYVIPSENEWYKAAYFDPAKPGGAGYWQYPTRSNTAPSNVFDPSGTNNANCYVNGESIGRPYRRTEVGAFAASPGPYGTLDQGGNVWEWCGWVLRGGAFSSNPLAEKSTFANPSVWWDEYAHFGFRIAYVPEPATVMMLALAGMTLLRRR